MQRYLKYIIRQNFFFHTRFIISNHSRKPLDESLLKYNLFDHMSLF